MTEKDRTLEIKEFKKRIQQLETEKKHLANELELVKEEKETARKNYFDIISHMEEKVAERSREIMDLQKVATAKGKELEMMLDASPAMIFYKDDQHRYLRVNREFANSMGFSPNKIVGKRFDELFPDEPDPFSQDDKKVMETGEPLSNVTRTVKTPRRTMEVLTNKIPYKDINGKTIGIVGFALDVTDLRKAEKEKHDLEEKLVQLEKMEAIARLAGGVAHDLNNVLSAVVSYPDLLVKKLPPDSPLLRPIETMRKSGQKAAAIVEDLLTLARRGVPITQVVNWNDIINNYLDSPEYETVKSYNPQVNVITHLEKDLLNIKGSPIHLTKTLMNLVSNAAEATLRKGTITISTCNRYVDRSMDSYDLRIQEGDYVLLTVSDTGIGIEPENMKRIFEPFYTKKVMGRSGTGLGMAVVWGTVKDHVGNINIISEEGKGTTFELYFPATRERLPRDKVEISITRYIGHCESILVVDDVPEQREISQELLKSLNYKVHCVGSGEEAIEYLKTNTVDLVILDMIMDPGIDGLDTFRQIIKDHPGQRAIITSGYSETERVKEAQWLGAGEYIKKPYTLENIGLAVRRELNRK